jgi:hypothetical protein
MKTKLIAIIIALAFTGCAALQQFTASHSAVIMDAETLAKVALVGAATSAFGPGAGAIASASLDALGVYIQGQVGKKLDPTVVKAMPGAPSIGNAVVAAIDPTKVVTQSDASTVFAAAKMAAK